MYATSDVSVYDDYNCLYLQTKCRTKDEVRPNRNSPFEVVITTNSPSSSIEAFLELGVLKAMCAKVNPNVYVIVFFFYSSDVVYAHDDNKIELVDMTRPTNWKDLHDYFEAIDKRWKVCVNCGAPALGTTMHLEHAQSLGSMRPAVIPVEYLLTRMVIIDVSSHTVEKPNFVLSLEVALQWSVLKHDPREPTLLVFKFGWTGDRSTSMYRNCVCVTPGLSYELADWIATNLTHVMGVATDAPTFETEQTRDFSTRTVANRLGKNGVYMIENVHIRKNIPDRGCMSLAMPLKLLNYHLVPTRVTAFCPDSRSNKDVVVAVRDTKLAPPLIVAHSRLYDVNLDDIL